MPEQTGRSWDRVKARSAVRTTGVLAAVGGTTTAAAGIAGQLTHTPTGTLLVVFGVMLASETLAFAGLALLDWLEYKKQQIFWQHETVDPLELVKEVKPGGKFSAPFFEIDNTKAVAPKPDGELEAPPGSPEAVNE